MYIKPGRMAEAVAHLKTAPPQEGVAYRLLRPISGAEAARKVIIEASFDDPDAQYASLSAPQPPGDWMQRWIELSQHRGIQELYQVRHAVEAEGAPGLWVDRRVRWMQDGKRGEAIRRWRQSPMTPPSGGSLRILAPRTGKKAGNLLVVESTFDSLTEMDANLSEMLSMPEDRAWAGSVKELEMHEPTVELLRMVP
jgi:hypothetical protein